MDDVTDPVVETIKARLKQWREDHTALFGELPDRGFCQPAADFEKAHGLTGISCQYLLPEGLSFPDLQSYALLSWRKERFTLEQQHARLAEVWSVLTTYNPGLKEIVHDPQDTDMLYHMVLGVASAYNADDIRHFISSSSKRRGWDMEESREFIKLTETFNRCSTSGRLNLGWVASPETLCLIRDKVAKKYGSGFKN